MAEGAEDDDRTEEPSQRKLDQAREKGDIIYSSEVAAALSLLGVTALVAYASGPMALNLARDLQGFLAQPDQFSTEPGALRAVGAHILIKAFLVFGIAAAALAGAGLAARYIQDKPTFTAARLAPKFDKLNPLNGFSRVFGKTAFANFFKSLAKFIVVGAALFYALWPREHELEGVAQLDPAALLPYVKDKSVSMLISLTSAAALIAAVDFIFTRQSYMKRMRMTKREQKEEFRQSEGDPMIKAKLRQIRLMRSRKRMMQRVPEASVVITNPTHFAVALKYVAGETPAPICLAKGVDAVALRIRAMAEEHDVPIIEDPPLARALFAGVELDEAIPREHYEAVAKIIGVVMRIGRNRRRRL